MVFPFLRNHKAWSALKGKAILALPVKVTYSCLARQKAASKLGMVVHLALLLILLRVSNAQAPPPPPGISSDLLSSIGLFYNLNNKCHSQGAAASHLHRAQCPSLHRQALPPPLEQGLESFFCFNLFQLFQGITASQLPQRPPGCTTQTALQTHLLLAWANGLRYHWKAFFWLLKHSHHNC